ncbi:hypothetical protein [Flocculibacter collagenilyticus]|uniref:hypothetical protein n=1 Tax=Flocculibacter collagenilyticus TaxID=2744479 RepID=UPI0018F37810|nr:hypothetical protein [Flocculibacter collagenilyticus]
MSHSLTTKLAKLRAVASLSPYAIALVALGLNQTIMMALLPTIAELMGMPLVSGELGILVAVANLNLVSYWYGSGWWGRTIGRWHRKQVHYVVAAGFIIANLGFLAALFVGSHNEISLTIALALMGCCRLLAGFFSSALLPLSQLAISKNGAPSVASLSKNSSFITIGRIVGPLLVLLPLNLFLLLSIPILFILPLLKSISGNSVNAIVNITHKATGANSKFTSFSQQFSQFSVIKLALGIAVITTCLVGVIQLLLLSALTSLGYQGEGASRYFAGLMLLTSVIAWFCQRVIIPKFANSSRVVLPTLLVALNTGAVVLIFMPLSWLSLMIAVVAITLGVSGLPSWYTNQGVVSTTNDIEKGVFYGVLAQAHSSGHIVGTVLSAILLYFQLPLALLTLFFAILLSGTCVYLSLHAARLSFSTLPPSSLASSSKEVPSEFAHKST